MPNTLYVSTSGNDNNNGLTLNNAKLTISSAITASTNGDNIILSSGTYSLSSSLIINKQLNIQGSTDPSSNTLISFNNRLITGIQIKESNVTLSNISVEIGSNAGARCVVIGGDASGNTLSNINLSYIKMNSKSSSTASYSLYLQSSPSSTYGTNKLSNIIVQNCEIYGAVNGFKVSDFTQIYNLQIINSKIYNNSDYGLHIATPPTFNNTSDFNPECKNVTIDNCEFYNNGSTPNLNQSTYTSGAIYIERYKDSIIKNCKFTAKTIFTNKNQHLVQLNIKRGDDNGSNITIENNEFIGNSIVDNSNNIVEYNNATIINVSGGLNVKGRSDGTSYNKDPGTVTNLNCRNNKFTNLGIGLRFEDNILNSNNVVNLESSTFTNNLIDISNWNPNSFFRIFCADCKFSSLSNEYVVSNNLITDEQRSSLIQKVSDCRTILKSGYIYINSLISVINNIGPIQQGINIANLGEIIYVSKGIYNEQVTINKSVTLLGAQQNVSAINNNGTIRSLDLSGNIETIVQGNSSSSGICFTIMASNVVVNGFKCVLPSSNLVRDAFNLKVIPDVSGNSSTLTNILIKNNIIQNLRTTSQSQAILFGESSTNVNSASNGNGIWNNIEIANNYFDASTMSSDGYRGIQFSTHFKNVTFSNINIHDNYFVNSSKITSNRAIGVTSYISLSDRGPSYLNGMKIKNNYFNTPGNSSIGGLFDCDGNCEISNNTFQNCKWGISSINFRENGGKIENNNFTVTEYAIGINDNAYATTNGSNISIINNNFNGDPATHISCSSQSVDFTNLQSNNMFNGYVLKSANTKYRQFDSQNNPELNRTTRSIYPTIQKGVNASGTENIYVGSGTYNEKVNVSKSIVIEGINKNKTCDEVFKATVHSKVVGGFTLNYSDITINGFEIISDDTNSYPIIGNTNILNNNNITIKSNYIHDIKSQQGIYRAVTNNYVSNWLIDNNYVSDFMLNTSNTTAIYPNGIDCLTISNNKIKHYTNGENRRGLNIDACSIITITNNEIDMQKEDTDDIYCIQLFWSYQKSGNIGAITITNNNLIGANWGVVLTSKYRLNNTSIINNIDSINVSNNTFDSIDWIGIQVFGWVYNYNFVIKNVNVNNNLFKNMGFLSMSLGPDYLYVDGEYGIFNSDNAPLQNFRIYNNQYKDNNDLDTNGYINLFSPSSLNNYPQIILSDNPSTELNNNGIVLDKSFKYLHKANINGSSGYYSPSVIDGESIRIPNPIRIISNSNDESVFDKFNENFVYVNDFNGISDKNIKDLLSNSVSILPGSDINNVISSEVNEGNNNDLTLVLDNTTYYSQLIKSINDKKIILKAKPNDGFTIIRYQP